jgi:hypothetical protein
MACAAIMPREWHYRASNANLSGFLPRKIRFSAANQRRDSLISSVPSKGLQLLEGKVFRPDRKLDECLTFSGDLLILSQSLGDANLSLPFSSNEVIPT